MADDVGELIERDAELGLVEDLLSAAVAGSGGGLLFRSPAGMGKTALLDAGREVARRHGLKVLSARGGLLEHEFPFGVVRQLLAGVGAAAALADDETAPAIPDGDFSIVYAAFWALVNAAADGPLCLFVDDLHWADGPSIRVLDFLLRRIHDVPIAVVAALRSGEPPPGDALAVLPELEAEGLIQVVGLAPLTVTAVAALATQTFGAEVEPKFASACHDRTAGNPFFVWELLRELRVAGAQPSSASTPLVAATLPKRAGRIVVARIKRLGADCSELARAVAILADHATLTDAAELARLPPERAAAAAEQLTTAGLLRGSDGLEFVHPLMRDAVESDMPREVVSYWHSRAADVLAARARDPRVVAAHQLLAPGTSNEAAVERLLTAARLATNHAAPKEAITFLRRALAEPPAEAQLRDVLFDLGSAAAAVGDPDAVGHLEAAREHSTSAEARAEVSLTLARIFMLSGQPHGVYPVVDEAQRELGLAGHDRSLALQAMLMITRSMDAAAPARPSGERDLLAALAGESLAERAVLACLAFDQARTSQPIADTNQLIDRILALGGVDVAEGADPFVSLTFITAIQWCGRLGEAERLTDHLIDYARRVNSAAVFAEALGSRAMTRWRAGALEQAEADARQSLEVEGSLRRARSPVAVAALARLLIDQGRAPEALDLVVESAEPDLPRNHVIREIGLTTLGCAQFALRRYDEAVETLAEAGRIAEGVGTVSSVSSEWQVRAAEALHAVGRRDEASGLIATALRHARRSGSAPELGPTLRVAARLDECGARELLHESADVLQGSGLRLELARTQAALGVLLRQDGDIRAARELLELAMDAAQRSGATPLAVSARAELIAAGGRPRRWERSGVNSLTPSERRVVELAASGDSNREIAQHLFVSTRTAESHLRNAFRKLGVSSRGELARIIDPPRT